MHLHPRLAGWLAWVAGMQAQAPLPRQRLFLPRKLSSSLSLQVSTLVQLLGSEGRGESHLALSGPQKGKDLSRQRQVCVKSLGFQISRPVQWFSNEIKWD